MDKKEEKALIKGVLRRDKSALSEFKNNLYPKVFGFVAQKIDDSRDVEEVAQDTLMDAIICLPRFSFKSSLSTWVIGITRHNVADFYRKKKIKTVVFSFLPSLEKIASQALSPETALDEVELKRRVLKTLIGLSEGYRHVLRLKYVEGLKVKQIALLDQKSAKAVEMKLRRARIAFRRAWMNEISINQTNQLNFEGDLSLLAKHFGVDLAPLFDSAKNSD